MISTVSKRKACSFPTGRIVSNAFSDVINPEVSFLKNRAFQFPKFAFQEVLSKNISFDKIFVSLSIIFLSSAAAGLPSPRFLERVVTDTSLGTEKECHMSSAKVCALSSAFLRAHMKSAKGDKEINRNACE